MPTARLCPPHITPNDVWRPLFIDVCAIIIMGGNNTQSELSRNRDINSCFYFLFVIFFDCVNLFGYKGHFPFNINSSLNKFGSFGSLY